MKISRQLDPEVKFEIYKKDKQFGRFYWRLLEYTE